MKKFIVIILMFSSLKTLSQDALTESTSIEWNEFYKLRWADFNGSPAETAAGDAGTVVQIKAKPFLVKGKVAYDIRAFFDRQKSWKRDESRELLAHEQLHFDLAELYARKIRQKISELHRAGVDDAKTYNLEIGKILTESNEVDMQYDLETLHGALDKKQAEWATSIKADLASLRAFKKTKRIIKPR